MDDLFVLPISLPTAIRSRAERDFVAVERGRLRMRLLVVTTEYANSTSELIRSQIEQMQMEHDRLDNLIYAYDRRLGRLVDLYAGRNAQTLGSNSLLDALEKIPGELIRQRLEQHYSLEQLACKSGLTRSSLIRYEQVQYRCARFDALCAIARVLQI